MSEGAIAALVGLLATPIAIFFTWMANRKKHVADIYGLLTESSQNAVEVMQTAMETLHDELERAMGKIDILQKQIEDLQNENRKLLEENALLHEKIDQLMAMLPNSDEGA